MLKFVIPFTDWTVYLDWATLLMVLAWSVASFALGVAVETVRQTREWAARFAALDLHSSRSPYLWKDGV